MSFPQPIIYFSLTPGSASALRFGLLRLGGCDPIHPIEFTYWHADLTVDAQCVNELDLALGGRAARLTLLVHDMGQLPGEEVARPPVGVLVPNSRIRHNLTIVIFVSRCRYDIITLDDL